MDNFIDQKTLYKGIFGNFFQMQETIERSTMLMCSLIPGFPKSTMNLLQNLTDAHETVHVNFLKLIDTGITEDFNMDDHNWLKVIMKHIGK